MISPYIFLFFLQTIQVKLFFKQNIPNIYDFQLLIYEDLLLFFVFSDSDVIIFFCFGQKHLHIICMFYKT